MKKTEKTSLVVRERTCVAAIAEHLTGSAVLMLDGTEVKAKELHQKLQAHLDAVAAADALKAKWQTAVASELAQRAANASLMPALRSHLISEYGSKSQIVADFGFTPKQRSTTVDAQAAGIIKRAATRKARGTMGKKQKAKIVGVVPPAPVAAKPAATS